MILLFIYNLKMAVIKNTSLLNMVILFLTFSYLLNISLGRNLQQVSKYTDQELEKIRKIIKGWSPKDKECNQVYAVNTGSPVAWSSYFD